MSSILQCAMPFSILFNEPKPVLEISKRTTQILFGESFSIEDQEGPFLRGTAQESGVSGWLHQDVLTPESWLPTHYISHSWAPVFPNASYENWAMVNLPFLSKIEVDPEKSKDPYAFIPSLRGYVHISHITPLSALKSKQPQALTQTAEKFTSAAYQLGGKSFAGMDEAGFLHLCLTACGYPLPHSFEIIKEAGETVDQVQKNNLIFASIGAGITTSDKEAFFLSHETMKVEKIDLSRLEIKSMKRFTAE